MWRRAVSKRVQEFAAGRLCARRALAEFGIVDLPIKAADDRQPIWPDCVVASITRTVGFGAAVVAERQNVVAFGLDSEVVGDVDAEVWPSICVPIESGVDRVSSGIGARRRHNLDFFDKEAFYKCQYPLVGERLDFHDVRVEAVAWGASCGAFWIHATRRIALHTHSALTRSW